MDAVYYFAVYFATICDNHKNTITEKNNFNYIRNYYNSIISLTGNVVCYILHDHLNKEFIQKYENKKIKFIKIDIKENNKLQPHDLRFFEVYKILEKDKNIQNIFITDISDCIIIKNGLPLLNENNYLYICTEGENIYNNKWMKDHLKYIYIEHSLDLRSYRYFAEKNLLNSGIVGGKRNLVMDFLRKCMTFMDALDIKKTDKPLDMIAFNFIAHTYFNSRVYNGKYLHTRFGFREYNNSCYFKHK